MPKKRRRSSGSAPRTGRPQRATREPVDCTSTSGRYTAPTLAFRLRPRWHRWAGWLGLGLGLAIIIANDAMFFTDGVRLLPGGHNELYLLLGLAVGGAFSWFLGLFDRGTTIFN